MPDTAAWLLLGLAAIALVCGALLASIVIRHRQLDRDAATLAQLAARDEALEKETG